MDEVIARLESIPPGPDDDDEPDSNTNSFEKLEEKPAPGTVPDDRSTS